MHHYGFFIASSKRCLLCLPTECLLTLLAGVCGCGLTECRLISAISVLLSTMRSCCCRCCHRCRTCECCRNVVVVITEPHNVCQYDIAYQYILYTYVCVCYCSCFFFVFAFFVRLFFFFFETNLTSCFTVYWLFVPLTVIVLSLYLLLLLLFLLLARCSNALFTNLHFHTI